MLATITLVLCKIIIIEKSSVFHAVQKSKIHIQYACLLALANG